MIFKPKVSVITVVLNNVNNIKKTIESVLHQKYPNIEYIIIDGGSTDGTLDVINKYKGKINYLISEKDEGIFSAMNKGINVSTGEYICFLNSGDHYSENFLEDYLIKNYSSDIDIYHSNLILLKDNRVIGKQKPLIEFKKMLNHMGNPLLHPTVLSKKYIFLEIGKFNLKYTLAADHDWCFNAIIGGYKLFYLDKYNLFFDIDGVSNSNRALKESQLILESNGLQLIYSRLIYVKLVIKKFVIRCFKK